MEPQQSRTNTLLIPLSIIVAGAMVAGTFFYTRSGESGQQAAAPQGEQPTQEVRPVSEDDHIRGNPNADIVIIEYSDFDCPFCAQFHETMKTIVDEYGREGQVAWVYRHFPIEELHPNATRIAMGSECVAELAGADAFWTFTDAVYASKEGNEPFDLTLMSDFAEEAGAGRDAFNECMGSGRTRALVEADFEEAVAIGARGTPHNIIIAAGQQAAVPGAQPLDSMRRIIDTILEQL
ncbi:thioredoxin domain-containing protein [Patescibacteria group bacterium]|jgi:protein-disulfide isomerase|nr:thioredoxin domain-containing protein [Patescibacteria group bacterium]